MTTVILNSWRRSLTTISSLYSSTMLWHRLRRPALTSSRCTRGQPVTTTVVMYYDAQTNIDVALPEEILALKDCGGNDAAA